MAMVPAPSASLLDKLTTATAAEVVARSGDAWGPTRTDFGGDAQALAAALLGYGLAPGGRVAVLGGEGADTLLAEIAVLLAGARLLSFDPASSDGAIASALAAAPVVQAIASDERQLARLLAMRPDLPSLDLLLLMHARPSERKPAALLADVAIGVGRSTLGDEPELLREAASEAPVEQAVVFHRPAGVPEPVDRPRLFADAVRAMSALPSPRRPVVLSALPIAAPARLSLALAGIAAGGLLLLADPSSPVDAGLAEQSPGTIVLNPRGLAALRRAWLDDVERRSWLKRAVARWSLRQTGDEVRGTWKGRLADSLTLRSLKARLGGATNRLEVVRLAGDPTDRETERFFAGLGIEVKSWRGSFGGDAGPTLANS